MPKEIQERTKPMTLHYFVNCMTVLSGKEEITFSLLLKNVGDNYNMASACCNTFLAGHSLAFSGNCAAVPVKLGTLSDNVEAEKPLVLRWFPDHLANDSSVDNEIPMAWLSSDGKPDGSDGWAPRFATVMGVWGQPVSDEEDVGKPFSALLEAYKENGGTVRIVQN
jgi:hypothetical protein